MAEKATGNQTTPFHTKALLESEFYSWIVSNYVKNKRCHRFIHITDESTFRLNAHVAYQNSHHRVLENPYYGINRGTQTCQKVNVWYGILFDRNVSSYLMSNQSALRWICGFDPIHCPSRSPEITPLDFLLWDALTQRVYWKHLPYDREALRDSIHEALNEPHTMFRGGSRYVEMCNCYSFLDY